MRKILSMVAVLVLLAGQQALADSIAITATSRPANAGETTAADQPVPAGSTVWEYFATTDGDVLAVNFANTNLVGGTLYQNSFGTPGAPPNPALIGTFPSLAADSYITTPGTTSVLGGGLPADGDDTFGDTTDDGPQNMFKFAQLTIPAGTMGGFAGQFDIVGSNGVFSENFDIPFTDIPEPGTLILAGMGLIGIVAGRRRR